MHRLETVLFSNGERFPLLVNVKTGIPDFYSTLWVTVELRNQSAVGFSRFTNFHENPSVFYG